MEFSKYTIIDNNYVDYCYILSKSMPRNIFLIIPKETWFDVHFILFEKG